MSQSTTFGADTTAEVRIILRGTNSSSNTRYHRNDGTGNPACRFANRGSSVDKWPAERARAWREPCSYCFPDGDDGE